MPVKHWINGLVSKEQKLASSCPYIGFYQKVWPRLDMVKGMQHELSDIRDDAED